MNTISWRSNCFRFENTVNAARLDSCPHFIESNHASRNHIVHSSARQQAYNNSIALVTAVVPLGVLFVVMYAVLSVISNHDHISSNKIKHVRVYM